MLHVVGAGLKTELLLLLETEHGQYVQAAINGKMRGLMMRDGEVSLRNETALTQK
jgi:hypothetical protein